jgi:hypothetical protein
VTAELVAPGVVETFPDLVQRSDEWYQQRCGLITASAVGGLLTTKTLALADNDTSRGLIALAAAERITGHVDLTAISYDMARGIGDESYAADAYSEHIAPVIPCGFMVRTWGKHALGYSPDGLIGTDGLIEIKSRRGQKQVQTVLAGHIPAENVAQCQAGLLVSGRAWLDYVSYAAGMHLWTIRVTPDPRWFEAITAAVEAFEDAVTKAVTAYREAVTGLPLAERPAEDMVI